MTITPFYYPNTITNVPAVNDVIGIPSIDWNFTPTVISDYAEAVSSKPLYTISGLWMEKFLSNTSQLWCTNFNIPNTGGTVVGIEFQLKMQRAARIEDLVIQLVNNNQLIGNNYASTINPVQSDMYTSEFTTPVNPVGDYNIYGSSTDLWGTTGLTSSDIANTSFGIAISFKSNVIYPHRDLAYVSQVGLRITYA